MLDQTACDVADGNVTLLDALRVMRGDIQEKIHFGTKMPAGFTREGHEIRSTSTTGFHAAKDIGAVSAG